MSINPDLHNRRSIRLPDYDYSGAGGYFVTICTQGKVCLFGDIMDGKMKLNAVGLMIKRWWKETANKYESIQIDEYIVMPNHFHGIVIIQDVENDPRAVGAALCGRPGHARRRAPTLGDIVRWFKTMTTNEYIRNVKEQKWPPFPGRLWQRNYYEHVIRNETSLNRARRYVVHNPMKWQIDPENPKFASRERNR